MKEIAALQLRAACRARDRASAVYLRNPRVTLIDVGYRIKESEGGQRTEELAVRVHMRHKPRGAALEAFTEARPDLYIDETRIPYLVDFVTATYQLHWHCWDSGNGRQRLFWPLRGGVSIGGEWLSSFGRHAGRPGYRSQHRGRDAAQQLARAGGIGVRTAPPARLSARIWRWRRPPLHGGTCRAPCDGCGL